MFKGGILSSNEQLADASCGAPDNPAGVKAVRALLRFAGPRRKLAYAGTILAALNGVLTVVSLVLVWFVLRDFVAVAPHWDQAADATLWAWLAFGAALLGLAVYFGALMLTHTAAFRVAANMRKQCLAHVARVPLGYFDAHASGHLRRVIDGCAGQTEDVIAHKMPDFVASLTAPVAFLVAIFCFDWVMGLVCLIPVAVSFFAMWWMMGREVEGGGRHFMALYQNALNRMSTAATEYVRGIPVVKVFQQTVHSFRAFHDAIMDYRNMATNYVRSCRMPQVAQLTAINGTFAVLVPAAILLAYHTSDFGLFFTDFLFYVVFSALTTTMMNKVMYSSEAVMMAEDSMRRVMEVLAVVPLTEATPESAEHPADASVRLEDATFTYPGAEVPAVNGVTLAIPAGATVALVGPSGGGKTTVASLVPRFWDVERGQVLVGGADVRRVPTAELMDTVAFVFQNDRLFKGTIADNIRLGRPNATDREVAAAARAAQCDDILAKFADGLETRVGSDGVYLSGGECQRVALARAILKDAPVVVLDEATAFADPENEALIQRALARLTEGKTVLMIAHRLSTVVGADLIAVLDDGRVAEQGTHRELLEEGGLYARMWADYNRAAQWKIESGEIHAA